MTPVCDQPLAAAPGLAAPTRERIVGLDLWRAFLMLGGLLRHSAEIHGANPLFAAIIMGSASFRMGTFFGISGLLAGFAMSHRPPAEWTRCRLRQIGIPTLFGLIVLCPLVSVLHAATRAAEGGRYEPEISWFHLWFLVALLIYTVVAYVLLRIDARTAVIERVSARLGSIDKAMLLTATACYAGVAAVSWWLDTLESSRFWNALGELRWMVGYLPIFLLGFCMARSRPLFDRLTVSSRLPALIVALVVIGELVCFGGLDVGHLVDVQRLGPQVFAVATSVMPVAMLLLVVRSARAIAHVPAPLVVLADASFTIYLLHVPVIAIAGLVLAEVALSDYAEFSIALAAAAVVPLSIHWWLVRRSPLLMLLLNGRVRSGMASSPATRSVVAA